MVAMNEQKLSYHNIGLQQTKQIATYSILNLINTEMSDKETTKMLWIYERMI